MKKWNKEPPIGEGPDFEMVGTDLKKRLRSLDGETR